MNHYSTNSYFNKGGRHYWFAENLIKKGYKTTIFCANQRHNNNDEIKIESSKHTHKIINNIPFVFIKTTPSSDNGLKRIKNMFYFYRNLLKVAKKKIKKDAFF